MRVETTGQTNQFVAYAGAIPQRTSRSDRSSSVADIFVVALWSATGLALSALFAFSSGNTMADMLEAVVGLTG